MIWSPRPYLRRARGRRTRRRARRTSRPPPRRSLASAPGPFVEVREGAETRANRPRVCRVSRVSFRRTQRTERLAAERRPNPSTAAEPPAGGAWLKRSPTGQSAPASSKGTKTVLGETVLRAHFHARADRKGSGEASAVFKRGERAFVRRTHILRGALGDRDGLRRLQRLDFRIGPARQKVIPARELLHVRAPARPRALGRLV